MSYKKQKSIYFLRGKEIENLFLIRNRLISIFYQIQEDFYRKSTPGISHRYLFPMGNRYLRFLMKNRFYFFCKIFFVGNGFLFLMRNLDNYDFLQEIDSYFLYQKSKQKSISYEKQCVSISHRKQIHGKSRDTFDFYLLHGFLFRFLTQETETFLTRNCRYQDFS